MSAGLSIGTGGEKVPLTFAGPKHQKDAPRGFRRCFVSSDFCVFSVVVNSWGVLTPSVVRRRRFFVGGRNRLQQAVVVIF